MIHLEPLGPPPRDEVGFRRWMKEAEKLDTKHQRKQRIWDSVEALLSVAAFFVVVVVLAAIFSII